MIFYMKNIETKLNDAVKLLLNQALPNEQELLNAYEDLKAIFNCSVFQGSLFEIIRSLKKNLFYQHLKLDTDPQFLKAVLNKSNDHGLIKKLWNSSEIHYSQQEKTVLKQRFHILVSLSLLDKNLEDLKNKANGKGGLINPQEFFQIYFKDLETLKEALSSESLSIKNINWFLDSDLFQLISCTSYFFGLKLMDFYETLLQKVEINTNEDFFEHRKVLKKAIKENSFFYQKFDTILINLNKELASNVRSNDSSKPTHCYTCISKKFSKLNKLSPIAKEALINNLKKYINTPTMTTFNQ